MDAAGDDDDRPPWFEVAGVLAGCTVLLLAMAELWLVAMAAAGLAVAATGVFLLARR